MIMGPGTPRKYTNDAQVDFHRRNKPNDYTPLGIAPIRDGPKPISANKYSLPKWVPRRFHDYHKNLEYGKNEDAQFLLLLHYCPYLPHLVAACKAFWNSFKAK
nr:unnamed protein product [Callosobruchus analis]